ncbi:MAG TPA: DUF6600 domain-containing protein [Usitatibacter sp.]|nr:DUF6600 domain-containing protein [Usitatibacter sp.]
MRSIAIFLASLAFAYAQAATAQDIPSRVGRLAFTQGQVSVYQDPELGWDKAYVNTPVTSENSVWTDRGARAEVRVGGIAVRLDGETQLDVSRLDDDDFDAGVARGSINVRVRYKQGNDHITLNTAQALFILDGDGRYRLDVDEDREQARLTVFSGHAQMESSQGRIPVEAGRMIIVSGGQYGVEQARVEEFDRWADARDRQWIDSNSRNYVSSDMTGYEELDRYGSWSQDADYGSVWYPTQVSAGWAPYRYGHWTYVRPWGWTWIDDAAWGYAPSHYGRWVQVRNRWAWAPGYAVRESPVWAPAVVGFIGGAGFSVSLTAGSAAPVGWYPLAPWERYQPWYHANNTYVTRMNHYVVDRRPRWAQGHGDDWRHWNRDRAATVVNRDVFVSRRPVQNSVVRVAPEAIRSATVVSGEAVGQRVLPQRNELARYREENRSNVSVAAPTMMRSRTQQATPQASAAPQQQQQQQQVVRPDFRRRGSPPPVVAAPAGQQPPVSAPAPQAQNPAARVDRTQQRQAEEAARAQGQQQRAAQEQQQRAAEAQRQQQGEAQRAARDEQQRQERATREAQQQQQRQTEQQRRQQEQAQRDAQQQQQRAAQEAQQRQQQQAADTQRRREEAAQRAAQDTALRQQQYKQQQEQAQREAQQQQQRGAQEAQQRQQQQAADTQRRREEAAQRAAQDTALRQQQYKQQQEQAQREAARQQAQPQQAQPQQAQPQQANPAARPAKEQKDDKKEKDKKDKEKDKDKQ